MSFNYILHPLNGEKLSIFSNSGRELLKSYLRLYKTGGMLSNNQMSRYEQMRAKARKNVEEEEAKKARQAAEAAEKARQAGTKKGFLSIFGGGLLEDQARGYSKDECDNMSPLDKMLPTNAVGCLSVSLLEAGKKTQEGEEHEKKEDNEIVDTPEVKKFVNKFIKNFINGIFDYPNKGVKSVAEKKKDDNGNDVEPVKFVNIGFADLYFRLNDKNWFGMPKFIEKYPSYEYVKIIKFFWEHIGEKFNKLREDLKNEEWMKKYNEFRTEMLKELNKQHGVDNVDNLEGEDELITFLTNFSATQLTNEDSWMQTNVFVNNDN